MELPELNTDGAVEQAENYARSLCPWLPDPYTCDSCGVLCEADVVYDRRMYEYTDSWRCPSCDTHYYREEPWKE